jgi:hypothetical protein
MIKTVDCPCCDGQGTVFDNEGVEIHARLSDVGPELLQSAKDLLRHLHGVSDDHRKWDTVLALESIIAKAEGK